MVVSDPLAHWWRHEVTIEPLAGSGAYGDVYAAPFTWTCAIDDSRKLVRDAGGNEVVSETRIFGPIQTGHIPLGSRVTLPASHEARTTTVLVVSRHDSGGLPTPDHVEVALA